MRSEPQQVIVKRSAQPLKSMVAPAGCADVAVAPQETAHDFTPEFQVAVEPEASQPLFGIEGGGELVMINPSTGVTTEVGPIGFDLVSALAADASGALFATHTDPRQPGPQLITIDALSGVGTAICDFIFPLYISALAFSASEVLFGVTRFGDLVTVDQLTGAITPVGPTGVGSCGVGHVEDIAFDASGTLFGVTVNPADPTKGVPNEPSRLVTIDPMSGDGTRVAPLDPEVVVSGIVFDASGSLFGVTCDLAPSLITINPSTGAVTVVGPLEGANVTCVSDLVVGTGGTALGSRPITLRARRRPPIAVCRHAQYVSPTTGASRPNAPTPARQRQSPAPRQIQRPPTHRSDARSAQVGRDAPGAGRVHPQPPPRPGDRTQPTRSEVPTRTSTTVAERSPPPYTRSES